MTRTSLPSDITRDIRTGRKLAGDDYSRAQIEVWLDQEREAYFAHDQDGEMSSTDPWYSYMRYVNDKMILNSIINGKIKCKRMLIIGPGAGEEVVDLSGKRPDIELTFVEASESFQKILKKRFPGSIVQAPEPDGSIDMPNAYYDVVLTLSVLHHIANVTCLIEEISRLLSPGGHFYVREPCSSMGDWRYPRSATPNERGISKKFMMGACRKQNLVPIYRPVPILFEPLNRFVMKRFPNLPINFRVLMVFDRLLSFLVSFNDYYWRDTLLKKIGPSSYQYHFVKRT